MGFWPPKNRKVVQLKEYRIGSLSFGTETSAIAWIEGRHGPTDEYFLTEKEQEDIVDLFPLYFDGKKVYTITEEEEKTKFFMSKNGSATFGSFIPYMTTDAADAIRQRNSLMKSFPLNVKMLKE